VNLTLQVAEARPIAPFAPLLGAPAANLTLERAGAGSVKAGNAAVPSLNFRRPSFYFGGVSPYKNIVRGV
jgi:hypothetical protein